MFKKNSSSYYYYVQHLQHNDIYAIILDYHWAGPWLFFSGNPPKSSFKSFEVISRP